VSQTQFDPEVTGLPGGGFAVVFTDDAGDGNGAGIRIRFYDAAGVPAGDDAQVNTEISSTQSQPSIAAIQPDGGADGLAAGGVIVVWSSFHLSPNGVFAQVLGTDGTPIGAEFQISATATAGQTNATVAGLVDGRFATVWEDGDADGSSTGVFAQVFEGNGTPVGGVFQVNLEASSAQFDPAITATTDGGFVISWTSITSATAGDGNGQGVFARRFDADGSALTGEVQLNEQIASTQNLPDISALANGEFVAVWTSATSGTAGDGDGQGVFQRIFGDPLTFAAPSARPQIEAFSTARTFNEADVNAAPQRLDIDGAVAFGDIDTATFAGGRIILASVGQSLTEDGFAAQDADAQLQLGVLTGGAVSVSGANVSVGGAVVATIGSDGANGAALLLNLTGAADAAAVEILLENLTFAVTSDDPRPQTTLELLVEDGQGATSDPLLVTVDVTPQSDIDGFIGTERQVNTVTANAQRESDIAGLSDGGYISVWTSTNQDNPGDGDLGIFAQRYDAAGGALGPEFQVNTTVTFSQFAPQVAGLTDGGWVIVWDDDTINGIRLSRYDAAGTLVVDEVQVETETSAAQFQPEVTGLSTGGYVVSWTSQTSGGAGDGSSNGVIAQVFDSAGARVGGETIVNEQTASAQDTATGTALSAGRFVVVWEENDVAAGDGSSSSIAARVFDASGTPEGAQFQVNTFTNNAQTNPQVATLSGGDFVIVWRSEGQDGSSGGIYYQRYSDAGVAVGGEIRVNDTTIGNQTVPDIIALDTGGFVIGWTDTSSAAPGSGSDIYTQVFDADGTRLDTQTLINANVSGEQDEIALAALPDGNYVVQWTSSNAAPSGDGSGDGVFQQIIGDPAEITQSAAPLLQGLPDFVTLNEEAANAGTSLAAGGGLSLTDLDSTDFDGGLVRLSRIVTEPLADRFNAPDGLSQDSIFVALGGPVTQSGATLSVDGTAVATITSDGLNGADLVFDLLAGATPDRLETVLNALSYQTDSDNPRDTRTYSLLIEDGDGGLTTPRALEIRITQQAEAGAPVAALPEEQVNRFTPGAQDNQEVAALADGGWVVVWRSADQDGSGDGVFGQRYTADGARAGGEFKVNTATLGSQTDPVVTALTDGGWVVVWESPFLDNSGVNDTGIIAQRYAADGTPAGPETVVNTIVAGTQFDPAVATIPFGGPGFFDGGYVVVYTSDSGDGSSDAVLMQRFATDGTPVGAEQTVNTTVSGNQGTADVAVLAAGGIAVSYVSGSTVFVRVLNTDGTEAVAEAQIATSASDAAIAATVDGGFVLAWADSSGLDGSGTGVAAQRFDASGAPAGDVFVVNDSFSGTQSEPDVTVLDDGRFVIAWRQFVGSQDGSGDAVMAQVYSATGARLDGEFVLNRETVTSTQSAPHLAALPGGNFVATFTSVTSGTSGDGSLNGVFQQVFGDPADFNPGTSPLLQGLSIQAVFDEAEVNAGLQRLDADKTVALGDLDSPDFDGGVLTLSVDQVFDDIEQLNVGDGADQHQLGLVAGDVGNGDVQVAGSDVRVDGTLVGTLSGTAQSVQITFNTNATVEAVEAVLGNLGYANSSDAPAALTRLRIDLSDGDGSSAATGLIDVTVTPEIDSILIGSAERGVNAFTEGSQSLAQIAELAGGGAVVVWQSDNQDNPGDGSGGVFAQLYTAAGVPSGPEFLVNTTTPSTQSEPVVAATADGGFTIVWRGTNVDDPGTFDTGIIAQRYDAGGVPQGAEFVVNTDVVASQFAPAIAGFADGGFVVTYVSDEGDGSIDSIVSQRFDAGGAKLGAETVVNTGAVAGNQSEPDVATLVDGSGNNAGHVIVFTSVTDGTTGDGDRNGVFAQRFDAAGAPAGPEFLVNTTTADDQSDAAVSGLAGGGFVVVWTDDLRDGSFTGVFAQRYDGSGAPVGGEFRVNTDRSSAESDAAITALSDGSFVVSWTAGGGQDGSSDGIFAQRFAADGARIDGEVQINVETSSQQFQSALSPFGDGFAAVWSSQTSATAGDGSGFGIALRTFETAAPANTSPVLEDVERDVQLFADDIIAGARVLDNGIGLTDVGGAGFDGGALDLYYTSGSAATHQLSIATDAEVSLSGSTISVGGTPVGVIDGSANGAGGANLSITFNADADADAVQAIIERVAFGSTDTAANLQFTNVGIGFTLTDGQGGRSEPDSIYVRISSGSDTATGLTLDDFADPETETSQRDDLPARSEAALLAAPQLIDADVDFDDLAGTSFDGGFVQIAEVFNGSPSGQLSVQDQGTGAGQIGFDGTDVSYEGAVIGTVNPSLNGVNGTTFSVDLNAAATEADIEALVEALTFGLTGALNTGATSIGFDVTIRNQAGAQTNFTRGEQALVRDLVVTDRDLSPEAQVNTSSDGAQNAPRIAELSDGGYVVTWNSTDNTFFGQRSTYAQIYDDQGREVGVEFLVNDALSGDQVQPRAEGLSNGTFVLMWTDNNARDGSGQGVFAQRYQNDGTTLGDVFQINDETSSTQNQPEATDIGAGRFMAVWTSQASGTAGDGSSNGIFGRIFDAAGAPEGSEFQINATTSGNQNRAQVTTLPDGDVIVVWEDNDGGDGAGSGVFAQRIDTNGALVSIDGATAGANEVQINTTTAGEQAQPDVVALAPNAALPQGGYVVVWTSPDASGTGIFGQIYGLDGAAQGAEFQINGSVQSGQSDPVVTATPDGGFVVAWSDASGIDGSGTGVVAQRFTADGTRDGNPFVVNEEVSSTQSQPDVAVLNNGALAAVWVSNTSATAGDGSGTGIFQALFDQPLPAVGAMAPVLVGVDETVTFDEDTVNAAAQLINRDGAVSLTDMDSTDFDGGSILVQSGVRLDDDFGLQQLRGPGEGDAQDVFAVAAGNGVSISGNQISVNGTVIGTVVQDGTAGAPLEIALSGTAATPEAVEAVVSQLSYRNLSDNPVEVRQVAVQIRDGDGGSTGTQLIEIVVNSEVDRVVLAQGDEAQVNTYVPGNQSDAATAAIFDAGGAQTGYVVVWTSADQDRVQDANSGIFGQRYDLNGNPVGAEFLVNTQTEFTQNDPSVTGLPTGGFAVSWTDNSFANPAGVPLGELSTGTFGQVFDENGVAVGAEFLINDITPGTQNQTDLAAMADGTLVAVYTDTGSADGSGSGVFARLFDAAGTPLGASVQVNEQTSSTQSDGAVAVLADGRIAVSWTSGDSAPAGDGSSNGVFARLLDTDGTPLGGEFQVNTTSLSNQDAARVTALSDGGFVIVWDDDGGIDGSGSSVQLQRYDASGLAVGGEVLVNETALSSQFDPYVVALDTGGWVVAWSDNSGLDGNGQGVFGQIYDADGGRIDGQFQLNTENSSTQGEARLVALPNGGFTAVWTSFTSGTAGDGSSNGIFQQVFAQDSDVAVSVDPVLAAFASEVTLDEAAVNAGGQRFAAAVGLGDADSADFDGGTLTVSMVVNGTVQPQFAAPDDGAQDQLGFDTTGLVTLSGAALSVGGTVIGVVTSDGADGAPLVVTLGSGATRERVEDAVRSLSYANTSDDPETERLVAIQITDGDGGHVRETVQITITPQTDGGVPVGDEVQTNSFVTGAQADSHVATLSDGGYVIVWQSTNQDATGDSDRGVFAQRYDASGAPVGGEFQVNTTAAAAQFNPQVLGLSTGGFVVAWEDSSGLIGTDNDEEIALQIYDANGQRVGGEIAAPSTTHDNPDAPALEAFADGEFILARHGRNPDNGFIDEIYVQRYNDEGGTVGGEFVIAPAGSSGARAPDVAAQTDGSYVVVFTDTNIDIPGDNDFGVFLQRFASDDSAIGGPIQVNTLERFSQFDARVAATEDGGYVVVYESDIADDFGFSTSPGIYAQRFDGAGNRVGEEFLVNEIVVSSQFDPDVTALEGGGFAITYSDASGTDGSGQGVFVQQYGADGTRIDGAVQINQEVSSTQGQGAIAGLPGGNFVVSFTSNTSGPAGDGSGEGIFHRIVGDPADFASGGDPVLEGINRTITYSENTLNGVPQLIDADGAVAVSDVDSTDFDGGAILVSNLISSAPLINQINAPDDLTQDQLGLRQTAQITIAGTDVSVDGTQVAEIVQNGQDGTPFELRLNVNADAQVVELLVENLTYRNISDDPLGTRDLRIQITDGDGGASVPQLVTITITPSPDAAQPVGGEQVVNATDTGAEDNPAVAILPGTEGDFVVVWEGTDSSGNGVFAQRFDVNGNKLARDGAGLASGASDEFQINTTTASSQFDPQIAGFSGGGWIVTWTDNSGQDGSGQGVIAQIFTPDGTPQGGEIIVPNLTSSNQSNAAVAVLADDTFVVTWESINSAGASDGNGSGILARHFNADGTPIAGQFVVNTQAVSEQISPVITALNDGGFAITWQSLSSAGSADGDNYGIFAQRYDATAAAVGGEFQINTSTRGSQSDPEITVLAGGNIAVTWTDAVADLSGSGIFATIIAPDGTAVVEEFRVNDERFSTQNDPVVAALDNGDFVIAWTDFSSSDGSGQGVFAQQYSAEGARVDSQFQVNTTSAGSQNQPDIAGLPGGGFVVTWNGSVLIQIYGNDAPSISPVSASGDEDTAIVLDAAIFEAGFFDADGNSLEEIRIETFPVNGTLTLSGVPVVAGQIIARADLLAGNLVYAGNADFNGADSFLWTGSDGIAFSSDPAVAANITVAPVNDAPDLEAGADTSLGEGAALSRALTLGDPDTDTRTFTVDYGDGSPVQTFNSASLTPVLNYTYGAEGTFTVTVSVDDNAGEANSVETDNFEVTVVNANPTAVNDFINADEDGPTATGNVLTNDSDPGDDPLVISTVNSVAADVGQQITLASGALFTLNSDGSFDYDPNGQFEELADFQSRTDQIIYEVADGEGGTDTATLNVRVQGENDDPDAVADAFAANDDSAISGNVLDDNGGGVDSDVDAGTVLSITAVNGIAADVGTQTTLASGALLTLNDDGTFDYDPNAALTGGGVDSFEYTLEDGRGGSDTATVTIVINGTNVAPEARDDAVAVLEDSTTAGDVLADNGAGADADANGDALTVTQVNGSTANVGAAVTLAGGGAVTLQSDGQFVFDPNGAYESLGVAQTATESFTYTIEDGQGGSDTATVTLTIAGANDAPVAVTDTANLTENETAAGNVLDNDTDIDANDMLFVAQVGGSDLAVGVAVSTSGGGTVTLGSDGGFTYDPGTAFDFLAVGETAQDMVQYSVADGNGGADTDNLVFTLSGLNDAPVAADDALSVGEDAILTGNVTGDNGNGADSDPDTSDIPFVTAVNGVTADIGSQITLASGARLVLNGSGTFSYDTNGAFETLNTGETATDSFTYTLSDGNGGSDTATATITIGGDADAPVAVDDPFTTNEDTAASGTVLGNDTDADEDVLSVAALNGETADVGQQVVLASGALLTLRADGTFDYDPNGQFEALAAGQSGTDSFAYTVSDGNGGTDTATVEITVNGVNDAPVAGNDTFSTDEDTGLSGLDLFANNGGGPDADIDLGDVIAVTQVNGQAGNVGTPFVLASGALLTVQSDGTAAYDPNGAFELLAVGEDATDSFTYTIDDGQGGTDMATVSIDVNGVNDAPDAVDDGFGVGVDTALSGNVLDDNGNGADSDPDASDALSVTALNGQAGALGTATLLASGALITLNADGTFDYDQNGSFSGLGAGTTATDTFTYAIADGNGGTDTATATITIGGSNLAPTAIADAFATNEDTALTTGSVLINDIDPNMDMLSVVALDDTGTLGLVTDNGDGTFDYDPNGQFESLGVGATATDTFDYTVSDGNGGTDTATVEITVNGVNDDPVAVDDTDATGEDTAVDIDVLDNDTDIDGDTLTVASVGTASNGSTSINLDGTVRYDPNLGFTGTDSFTYVVSDGNSGTDTGTVTVEVLAPSTAYRDFDEFQSLLGNTSLITFDDFAAQSTLVGDEFTGATINARALNVVDPTSLGLATGAQNVNSAPNGASASIFQTSASSIGFDNGDDNFEIVFDTPVEAAGLWIGNLGASNNDPVTPTVIQFLSESGTVIFEETVTQSTPGLIGIGANNRIFSGLTSDTPIAQIVVRNAASDGDGIFIDDVLFGALNTGPVAVADDGDGFVTSEDTSFITASVLTNDVDRDADVLTVVAVDPTATLGLVTDNGDGTFDYDPNGQFEALAAGQSGTDSFAYTVSDGNGGTDTATVEITVNGVNDAPVAGNDTFSTDEDTGLSGLDLFANNGGGPDADIDLGDVIAVTQVNGQAGNVGTPFVLASGALLTVQSDGTAAYDPNGAFELLAVGEDATDSFTYTIDDGQGGTDMATVSIDVNGVNDAPDAVDDGFGVGVDTALSGNVLDDNGNGADSDPDASDALSVTALNGQAGALGTATLLASGALITLNADGTFDYDQNGSFSGLGAGTTATDTFTYAIADGNGGTDTATATITIGGSNLAPTAIADAFAANEDTALTTGSVLINDIDPNMDTLSVVALDDTGTLGLVTDNGDGTFDYDPNGQFESLGVGATATDTFDYTVSDGNGGSDTATVTVTITGVNDAPVAMGDLLTVSEDTAGSVLVTLNDGDIDGDDVEVSSLDDTATLGTVAIGADADTVNYDPNGMFESLGAGETATDTFDYTVSDGNGGTDTATVTVTITGVNDAPVFGAVGPFAVDENTTAVGTVTASDVEGDVVSFSITGGDDGGLFDIDTTTGALSFKTAPDFEAPLDTGADNSYEIQVTVSDGTDTVDTFIFVDVRDVDEGGGVNVIQGTADPFDPLVGTEGRDEIRTGGGPFDDLTGGGGADTFVIEQTVGTRDLINILDYEVGTDVIDLQDRSVVFSNAFNSATYLFLDGDFDTIIVNGANSFADITFA